MAIGVPIERLATAPTVNSNVVTVSPTSTVAVGTKAIMPLVTIGSNLAIPTGVTDDAGNTWTVDGTFGNSSVGLGICSCNVTHAITTGNIVTITYGTAGNEPRRIWILEVAGLALTGIDQFVTASGLSGVAPTLGPTGTLVSANEIAFALFMNDQGNIVTFTPSGGFTGTGTPLPDASHQTAIAAYSIVSTAAPVTATGNWSRADANWRGIVATYQGVSAVNVFGPPTLGGRFHL